MGISITKPDRSISITRASSGRKINVTSGGPTIQEIIDRLEGQALSVESLTFSEFGQTLTTIGNRRLIYTSADGSRSTFELHNNDEGELFKIEAIQGFEVALSREGTEVIELRDGETRVLNTFTVYDGFDESLNVDGAAATFGVDIVTTKSLFAGPNAGTRPAGSHFSIIKSAGTWFLDTHDGTTVANEVMTLRGSRVVVAPSATATAEFTTTNLISYRQVVGRLSDNTASWQTHYLMQRGDGSGSVCGVESFGNTSNGVDGGGLSHQGIISFVWTSSYVQSVQRHRHADGSEAAPSVTFNNDTGLGMYRVAANELGWSVDGVQRFRLTDAVAELSVPLNLGDEDLATYDEGNFSPVFSDEGGNVTFVTNVIRADYVRIGNLVWCTLDIEVTSMSGTPTTGSIEITGLPFTAANASVVNESLRSDIVGSKNVSGYIPPASSVIDLYDPAPNTFTRLIASDLAVNSQVLMQFCYEAA